MSELGQQQTYCEHKEDARRAGLNAPGASRSSRTDTACSCSAWVHMPLPPPPPPPPPACLDASRFLS